MFFADDEPTAREVGREDRNYWTDRYDPGSDENDEPDDL